VNVLFLIDSNIAIASDPLGHDLEAGAEAALRFLRLASTHHHDIRTHPASRTDFARINDRARRVARLALFERYESLVAPPAISAQQSALLGQAALGSNDEVDQLLLASVLGDAAEYLVTEDAGLHKRANRLAVSNRVLTVADAIAMLGALHAEAPTPPPFVRQVKTHELDLADTIFNGLKDDYPDFEGWFTRAARTQRDAFLIDGDGTHAAIAIIKREPAGEFGLGGPQLKICTFKVADEYSGQKYGELLLKALFDRSRVERTLGLYVTVLEKQAQLIALLEDFGFEPLPEVRTELGELVYAKPHNVPPEAGLSALQSHVRYGPPSLTMNGTQPFIIPIEPRWHRVLFPDAEPSEESLFPATLGLSTKPFGNALRKAYLCNSSTRLLRPGDPLLFYRSSDEKAVYVVGVCEDTLVSASPDEIVATVGRRTVYSLDEITALTRKREVLVVLFRQDRILRDNPMTLGELQDAQVVTSWPQSITRTRKEGSEWLGKRLDA